MKISNWARALAVVLLLVGSGHCLESNVVNATWTTVAPMPTARYGLASSTVNGIIYAIGGYDTGYLDVVEAYDPSTNLWSTVASMPTARQSLVSCTADGIIYAIGGYNGDYLNIVEAYDPVTNNWEQVASMRTPRSSLGCATVDGVIYAIGGYDYVQVHTVEAYDSKTGLWTSLISMPTARDGLGLSAVHDVIYATGGYNGKFLNTVEAFDTKTYTWRAVSPMPTARAYHVTSVVRGILYSIGGSQGSYSLDTVESYDPTIDTWAEASSMPTPRSELASAVESAVIFAIGGRNGSSLLSTMEAYGRVSVKCQITMYSGGDTCKVVAQDTCTSCSVGAATEYFKFACLQSPLACQCTQYHYGNASCTGTPLTSGITYQSCSSLVNSFPEGSVCYPTAQTVNGYRVNLFNNDPGVSQSTCQTVPDGQTCIPCTAGGQTNYYTPECIATIDADDEPCTLKLYPSTDPTCSSDPAVIPMSAFTCSQLSTVFGNDPACAFSYEQYR